MKAINDSIIIPKIKKYRKIPPELSRKRNPEKVVAQNLLNGFVSNGSKGEQIIKDILGCSISDISLRALITVALLISDITSIKLERNYKRKKDLIVKWFNDNEEIIRKYIPFVKIIYE